MDTLMAQKFKADNDILNPESETNAKENKIYPQFHILVVEAIIYSSLLDNL